MTEPPNLREQAKQCRELASDADDGTAANLRMLATEFEAEAERLEGEAQPRPAGEPEQ